MIKTVFSQDSFTTNCFLKIELNCKFAMHGCTVYCCILTLDRAGCSSCVIRGTSWCTCVNRKPAVHRCKLLTWVELEMHRCYKIIYAQAFGQMSKVFANGTGDQGSIPCRVIPKTQKTVLDGTLLNTQHYKVHIKGKVEQSKNGVAPSPIPQCGTYWKREPLGRLWLRSTNIPSYPQSVSVLQPEEIRSVTESSHNSHLSVLSPQSWVLESHGGHRGPCGPLLKTSWEHLIKKRKDVQP